MIELNKIAELEKNLKHLQPLNLEFQKNLDKKFRLEFNFNTNHIEGNTITYSETELLLIFDDAKGNHTLRELEEMKGSDVAFQLIQELASDKERTLTEQNIKYLNHILLVRPFWKEAITADGQSTRRLIKVGDYKEFPNSVRLQNGEIFEYASPLDTPFLMTELINWFKNEEKKNELHPVVLAAMMHYKFVRIHPFDDGNGRISRLLLNYVLLKNDLPPIIIKTTDKKNYLSALNRADLGDLESFIKYIAEQLIWSLELTIKAAGGESLDEPGDLDKKIKILKQKFNVSEKAINIRMSNESIIGVYADSIYPLLQKISEKLGEFDLFFKSKHEYLNKDTVVLNGSNFKDCIGKLSFIIAQGSTLNTISYYYELKGFSKGNKEFNIGISLKIQFHENIYEVSSANLKKSYLKMYDEFFNEYEIYQIIEEIGNSIVNQIENHVNDTNHF